MGFRADVEVIFEFNHTRNKPMVRGFRPMHLILENYLTSGTHFYYDKECVLPGEKATGAICFLTPEAYPQSCWVGKQIRIQEGERVIGLATIIKVLNPLLLSDETES